MRSSGDSKIVIDIFHKSEYYFRHCFFSNATGRILHQPPTPPRLPFLPEVEEGGTTSATKDRTQGKPPTSGHKEMSRRTNWAYRRNSSPIKLYSWKNCSSSIDYNSTHFGDLLDTLSLQKAGCWYIVVDKSHTRYFFLSSCGGGMPGPISGLHDGDLDHRGCFNSWMEEEWGWVRGNVDWLEQKCSFRKHTRSGDVKKAFGGALPILEQQAIHAVSADLSSCRVGVEVQEEHNATKREWRESLKLPLRPHAPLPPFSSH